MGSIRSLFSSMLSMKLNFKRKDSIRFTSRSVILSLFESSSLV